MVGEHLLYWRLRAPGVVQAQVRPDAAAQDRLMVWTLHDGLPQPCLRVLVVCRSCPRGVLLRRESRWLEAVVRRICYYLLASFQVGDLRWLRDIQSLEFGRWQYCR